jgi:Ala-tRNA(Pro) deacylase
LAVGADLATIAGRHPVYEATSLMRVPEFLAEHHVAFETMVHAPAFTAAKRARVLQVPGKLLAKCVLLASPGGYVLAVLPATHYVDLDAVAKALGRPVRVAAIEEIADVFRDCEWGVAVPFGALYGLLTILDESFDREALLIFEAHLHAVAIRLRCCDFELLEKPRRIAFAQPSLNRRGQESALGPSQKRKRRGDRR